MKPRLLSRILGAQRWFQLGSRLLSSSEIARGMALFLGLFAGANLALQLRDSGYDSNLWWIDLRWLPASVQVVFIGLLCSGLLAFALRPTASVWRRRLMQTIVWFAAGVALMNALTFWTLLAKGLVSGHQPIPLSLCVAIALTWLGIQIGRLRVSAEPDRPFRSLAVTLGIAFLFPVALIASFGPTDYRRPADVAVVFGARVYADGRLSDAVEDRVRTACELYRQGWVHRLILSGGPGDGRWDEPEAMRRRAIELGVPSSALVLDHLGWSTAATVRNTLSDVAGQRVLAVSEFYHLPRIKLAYGRAAQEVYTVPARPRLLVRLFPFRSVVREVPAFWSYWWSAITQTQRV